MNAKEKLRQLHGFTGNQLILTEGPDKGTYNAASEGKLGEFCKELDNHTYNVYEAGYLDGMIQGKKLGGAIVLGGTAVIGCTVICLYLLSKCGKKSKLKQPCLKKESE